MDQLEIPGKTLIGVTFFTTFHNSIVYNSKMTSQEIYNMLRTANNHVHHYVTSLGAAMQLLPEQAQK